MEPQDRPMSRPPKVALQRVARHYGAARALDALDLTIEDGEFVTLLGPSGCGKTTTLRIIAGFVDPTAGRVLIDGRDVTDVPPNRREVGMVFQNYALFPHMNVADNIGFGMKQRGAAPTAIRARVATLLDLIDLPGVAARYPAELSGGQRQRIAIARAVAHPPKILLMDEPLGALDLKLRETMQQELRRIQRELAITTLYVTHDQIEAMVMSDRIVVMRDGRVEQVGAPSDIYMRPASHFVASFVGRITFLPVTAQGRVAAPGCGGTIRLPSTVADGRARSHDITIGLRPEWLRLLPPATAGDGGTGLDGRVADSVFAGSHVALTIDIGGGLTMSVDGRSGDRLPQKGEAVRVCWDADRAIVLDGA
jgi:ABC-type Fe3+/spermidine/putrescine transport system ATPase subunit